MYPAYDKTVQIFLASFNWVVWGLIAVGLLTMLYPRPRGGAKSPRSLERDLWFVVFVIALLPFLVVSYRFVTWNNARYIVPVSLLQILLLIRALESISAKALIRIALLSITLGLFLVSCFRTVDPVLLHFFPTFKMGEHRMSFYNSRLTLCDATLYNREYVY